MWSVKNMVEVAEVEAAKDISYYGWPVTSTWTKCIKIMVASTWV